MSRKIRIDVEELKSIIHNAVREEIYKNTIDVFKFTHDKLLEATKTAQKQAPEGFLSREEAMELLKISSNTFYLLTRSAKLPYQRVGRKMLFTREGIENYLMNHNQKAS